MQTDFQQIGENQFLITVPDADNINHIVVFLTGSVPFPDGTGGAGMYYIITQYNKRRHEYNYMKLIKV